MRAGDGLSVAPLHRGFGMRHTIAMPASTGVGLAVGAIAIFTYLLCVSAANAHDAKPTAAKPQGWKYPFSCCSGFDCREVPASAIAESPAGYVIKGTGEVIPHSDGRLKSSPDGKFHWCSVAGLDDSRTICLFKPEPGV